MGELELRYARWLAFGGRLGFAALVASFFIYLFGIIPPGIEPQDLPRYWGLPVAEYLAATGAATGWDWVRRLPQGDVLNFVGVAILGTVSVACYLRAAADFGRGHDRVYAAICVAQVLVLLIAASGVLRG
jgi:hypothetical protein